MAWHRTNCSVGCVNTVVFIFFEIPAIKIGHPEILEQSHLCYIRQTVLAKMIPNVLKFDEWYVLSRERNNIDELK